MSDRIAQLEAALLAAQWELQQARERQEVRARGAARRCAAFAKRGAEIQREHAARCKRENRWTDKSMTVSESGVEAYLTAANSLEFWEYQIRQEFGLDESTRGTPRAGAAEAQAATEGIGVGGRPQAGEAGAKEQV